MKKILVTGFKPFNGQTDNSSWEVARRLPAVIGEAMIYTKPVSVSFMLDEKDVLDISGSVHPDIILCLGQAATRYKITPEYTAINLRYAAIPDNDGYEPHDEPVVPGGPDAYFSNLPVRKMAEIINNTGVPAEVSYSAGTYVCNDLMYKMLHRYKGCGTGIGFIHIPLLSEQYDNEQAVLKTDDAVKAIEAVISFLCRNI